MWLRTLLIFILLVLLLRFIARLLRGVMQGASSAPRGQGRRGASSPVKMVADPVCGTFVVPGKALTLARGGETMYFCSEQCRDQWAHAH